MADLESEPSREQTVPAVATIKPLVAANRPKLGMSRLPTPKSSAALKRPRQASSEESGEDAPLPVKLFKNPEAKNPEAKKQRIDENARLAKPPVRAAAARPGSKPASTKPATRAGMAAKSTTRPGAAATKPSARATTASKPRPAPTANRSKVTAAPATTRGATAKKATAQSTSAVPPAAAGKKRAAWDYKGRLEDMELFLKETTRINQDLAEKVTGNDDRILSLESHNQQLVGKVIANQQQSSCDSQAIQDLQAKIREAQDLARDQERQYRQDREDWQDGRATLQRRLDTTQSDLEASRQEARALRASIASMAAERAGLDAELSLVKRNLESEARTMQEKLQEIRQLQAELADNNEALLEKDAQLRDNETKRRRLHNEIQELKGNIRVFCRLRPPLGAEDQVATISFPGTEKKELELERVEERNKKEVKKYPFSFDRVFNGHTTQAQVFSEVSQLVQSALDGYNVCIFAYGQTGSGKTFTMEGPDDVDEESKGIIPRTVDQIFQTKQDLEEKGWKYEMVASFLEIYKEQLRDLLGSGDLRSKCEVKYTDASKTDVEVTNCSLVNINSEKQIHQLLEKVSKNRAVAATNCNERSSRSHSVFRLRITGSNSTTGENCEGTLNLVDLAGSERLSQSGSTGERLKETQSINRSLTELGNVIMALANKEPHIPYRNSKLTQLLQNSLGGNSKTLMFVNISPKEDSVSETLCSLRFATKVNQCNIGTAQKKVK